MLRKLTLAFILGLLGLSFHISAVQATTDPQAEKILKQLKDKYDRFQSLEVSFQLLIQVPEEEDLLQEGKLIQQEDQYMVDLPDQAVYCNGKDLWVHLKNNEEVQINNIDEDDASDLLSPKDLLNMYNSDEFDYAYVGDIREKGILFQQIEFKPLDEFSDYSKIRIYVDKAQNELDKVIVFSKDGARYTMSIKKFLTNKEYPNDVFTFDTSKHPKIHIEDLRID